jgi:hypothetical protein
MPQAREQVPRVEVEIKLFIVNQPTFVEVLNHLFVPEPNFTSTPAQPDRKLRQQRKIAVW